uniref:Uncharacterized protein n=1 Tax=Arabidopsis thaliana TaxID=3702 RepID=Q0WLB9_ARATH|nr:hypothetical protein [Arabidopsis thaliana]
MVSITINSTSKIFCYNWSTTFHCMFQAFHHQNTSSFTHNKPISCFIPRPGSSLRVIISLGQCPTSNKTSQPNRNNSSLSPTSNHHISFTTTNVIRSSVKAVIRSSTSS